jgi:hypothetical protein
MTVRLNQWCGLDASDRARARIQFEGRTPSGHPIWTHEEDEIVRSLYPNYVAMRHRLRRRSMQALQSRAMILKLTRPQSLWTANEVTKLRRRWKLALRSELEAEFPRHSWSSIQNKGKTFGFRRRPWVPKSTGNPLIDRIRSRACDLKLSMSDLDEFCNGGRAYFKKTSRGIGKPRSNILMRAIEMLDGHIEIVWH